MFYHCGICNLNFGSQSELSEHFMGLAHQAGPAKAKGKNVHNNNNNAQDQKHDMKSQSAPFDWQPTAMTDGAFGHRDKTVNTLRPNPQSHFGDQGNKNHSYQNDYQRNEGFSSNRNVSEQQPSGSGFHQSGNWKEETQDPYCQGQGDYYNQDNYRQGQDQNFYGNEQGMVNFNGGSGTETQSSGGPTQLQLQNINDYDCDSELYPRGPGDTDEYCDSCRISLSSLAVAQNHYGGTRHQYKVRLLRVAKQTILQQGVGNTCFASPQTFCMTCRIVITSKKMGEVHYLGAKHKRKVKQLEDEAKKAAAKMRGEVVDESEPQKKKKKVEGQITEMETEDKKLDGEGDIEMMDGKNIKTGLKKKKGTKLVEKVFCDVCQIEMTSQIMAEQHYKGHKHKYKLLHHQKSQGKLAEEKVLDTNIQSDPSDQPMVQSSDQSNDQSKETDTVGEQNDACIQQKGPMSYCTVCEARFSYKVKDIHLNGAKHRRKAQKLQEMKENGESDGNSINDVTSVGPEMNQKVGGNRSDKVKKSNKVKPSICEVCRVEMTSKEMEEQHYQGNKHKNRLKTLQDKTSVLTKGKHFCDTCNIVLSSEIMAVSHRSGAKHKRNVKLLESLGDAQKETINQSESVCDESTYCDAVVDDIVSLEDKIL